MLRSAHKLCYVSCWKPIGCHISTSTEALQNKGSGVKMRTVRREKAVPASQFSRLVSFGGIAVNIGARVLARTIRDGITGKKEAKPKQRMTVLTAEDISKVVDFLCTVRGAAMKVGQIVSLQDESIMDPKIRAIFEKVRDSADCMPFWQAERVLSGELGSDWKDNFSSFENTPFAAASIGQVHRAVLKDGTVVAVKLQYPGVDVSINSDMNNLAAFLKMWDILPRGLYVDNLMRVIKRELLWEVNYLREAKCVQHCIDTLRSYPELSMFHVPPVIPHVSTKRILTTEYIDGIPIDKLHDDQDLRNKVGSAIWNLVLHEVFVWRFMQTDPNFSNFLFTKGNGKINLLDFGASRSFGKPFIDSYLKIIIAASEGDEPEVLRKSRDTGFLTGYESKSMEAAHVNSVMALGETLRVDIFDFSRQMATNRVLTFLPVMAKERLTPPPDESYSLHRKYAGIFMLLAQLGCVVPCRQQFLDIVNNYKFDPVLYTMANMPVDDGNTGIK